MRWPPDLHRRNVELFRDRGDGVQFGRRGEPAPHARHHRIGAVLLDVGVDTLIDEARTGIIAIFAGPGAKEIIVERGPAFVTALRLFPGERRAHRLHRLQLLCEDRLADLVVAGVGAIA